MKCIYIYYIYPIVLMVWLTRSCCHCVFSSRQRFPRATRRGSSRATRMKMGFDVTVLSMCCLFPKAKHPKKYSKQLWKSMNIYHQGSPGYGNSISYYIILYTDNVCSSIAGHWHSGFHALEGCPMSPGALVLVATGIAQLVDHGENTSLDQNGPCYPQVEGFREKKKKKRLMMWHSTVNLWVYIWECLVGGRSCYPRREPWFPCSTQ